MKQRLLIGALLISVVLWASRGRCEPPYRLIFNCDGNAVFVDAEGSTEQWLKNLFGPLEGSQVDALFWCDGSGGNTANYNSRVLELTGHRAGKVNPHLQRLLDEGQDPPQLVVREAHERGLDCFYSFRINDIHDSFIPAELPTFKKKHPEWMLGKLRYGSVTSFPTALNFAFDEVRELKYQTVREIFSSYDFDGLEIDFLRSAPYFPPDSIQANAHLLTDLLKRIRAELDRQGRKRNKKLRLAVRVDETLEGCHRDGFEVKRWIEEDLIDMLILGSGTIDADVAKFKQLTKGKPVSVHACLYGWPSKYSPIPRELACGLALNYWAQGADGIYLFNWFPHQDNNSEATAPFQSELLKKLGMPQRILSTEKKLMFAADRGRPSGEYPGNWLDCVLPARLTPNGELKFRLRTAGLPQGTRQLQLAILFDQSVSADQVEVRLNGARLELTAKENSLIAPLKANECVAGDNMVSVGWAATSAPTATVTAAELRGSGPFLKKEP